MKIIPALYLSGGRVVTRYKSQVEQSKFSHKEPLQTARAFEKEGAKIIHLVDSDAIDGGNVENRKTAKLIVEKTGLKVSYAEGISSMDEISELFSYGVDSVSLNQFSEKLIASALQKFGQERIAFTIQSRKFIIIRKPGVEIFDYAHDLAEKGITRIICRDLKAEGSFHPNFDEVEKIKFAAPHARIFAFGGIGDMSDLEILQRTGAYAAIISRAFLERRLSLQECIEQFEVSS